MNIISSRAAYSLFPHATFVQHTSLNIDSPGQDRDLARLKYANRGWKMISEIAPQDTLNLRSDFRIGFRWIGDKRTWTIPLPLESGKEVPTNEDLVMLNSFGLEYKHRIIDDHWAERLITYPKVVYELCESKQWRNTYTFSDRSDCQADWMKVLKRSPRSVVISYIEINSNWYTQ